MIPYSGKSLAYFNLQRNTPRSLYCFTWDYS